MSLEGLFPSGSVSQGVGWVCFPGGFGSLVVGSVILGNYSSCSTLWSLYMLVIFVKCLNEWYF